MAVDLKTLRRLKRKKHKIKTKDLLSSGSTLLNLACTDRVEGFLAKGMYARLIGDSSAGKTFLALTCLAEAARNPEFDDYVFVYDNPEDGAQMDFEQFFGKAVADRVVGPPNGDSETIEEVYFNIAGCYEKFDHFIYILDSIDAVTSKAEEKKFKQQNAAHVGNREDPKGDYGDGKARYNSRKLRKVVKKLKKSKNIVLFINQSRDNVGAGLFEPKKTASGGRALKFYASIQMWASCGKAIKKTVRKKKRQIGVYSRIKIDKNRINGKDRTIEIPIFYSYGMDDITSCIEFLVSEGHWKGGKKINAAELDFKGSKSDLIEHIEKNGLEKKLRSAVKKVWFEIEAECIIERKKRYA